MIRTKETRGGTCGISTNLHVDAASNAKALKREAGDGGESGM